MEHSTPHKIGSIQAVCFEGGQPKRLPAAWSTPGSKLAGQWPLLSHTPVTLILVQLSHRDLPQYLGWRTPTFAQLVTQCTSRAEMEMEHRAGGPEEGRDRQSRGTIRESKVKMHKYKENMSQKEDPKEQVESAKWEWKTLNFESTHKD